MPYLWNSRFNIARIFLRGLIVLLPAVITIYLIAVLVYAAENIFGQPLRRILPEKAYYPGMGVLVAVLLIFLFGLLLYWWTVRRLMRLTERVLERMPIVKSLYKALSGLMSYAQQSQNGKGGNVVLVTLAPDYHLLGLVTHADIKNIIHGDDGSFIAVYMPMSYQIGGYTAFVKKDAVTPIDMSIEDAMRFILTGGVGGDAKIIEHELQTLEKEVAAYNHRRSADTGEEPGSAKSKQHTTAPCSPHLPHPGAPCKNDPRTPKSDH